LLEKDMPRHSEILALLNKEVLEKEILNLDTSQYRHLNEKLADEFAQDDNWKSLPLEMRVHLKEKALCTYDFFSNFALNYDYSKVADMLAQSDKEDKFTLLSD
jgi:hypothetical protein